MPDALDLLRSLGAPLQPVRHGQIVSEVAAEISEALTQLGFVHDESFVAVAAVLHDSGKIVHHEELIGPGHQHETAGERLLLDLGMSPKLARVCRTHGAWEDQEVTPEERLIALADHIWKGTRGEEIERLAVRDVAVRLGTDEWEIFLKLDPLFEQIAAEGDARLALANSKSET